MPDFLLASWLGTPVWFWGAFLAIVVVLTAFDLGFLHKEDRELGIAESLKLSVFYITVALLFGVWVWFERGETAGMQYFTGFFIEKALSIDNVFVISLIFTYFAIPAKYQYRALLWGIIAVIILRGLMIAGGAALLAEAYWVLYLFAAFLVFTGIKMFFAGDEPMDVGSNPVVLWISRHMRVTPDLHGQKFLVKVQDEKTGKMVRAATPLLLALVVINLADLVFAVDSVPAIFAITTDTFIVYTSNIFAILGLRALYFALAAMIHRFHYLKYALAAILVFIGSKIFVTDFLMDGEKFPAWISLGVTFVLIAAGVLYSLWKTRGHEEADWPAEPEDEPLA
ncbi:TerC family protein [Qipengyuania citrea]|uniref:TerC family protein n=2 Tax=Qipengyuania TaxID=1855416 RepID=A0ABY4U6Z1_9SPHN|nr:TerC family protein [Qipengyuania citrea]MBX7487026.1 TerC family protein [Qipengyuania aerophila]MCH2498053.1 TerC family protein [Erythrobacter sp.]MEC7953394.1 TerC family protein [Pseudomonadota bacterium]MEE2795308.1 TerC family protein [Pseudomonadota bacterium]USA61442.1 TerC family protein [Qipengyuania citrea]